MNFYDILAAEKWGGGVPSINFFDLLFAQSISGGEQWQTYEGTLPATINANGDNVKQYQIYGNTGGVGDRTVNLFDKTATDAENGYEQGYYLCPPNISGGKWANSSYAISEYIEIEGLPTITFSGYTSYYSPGIENEFYNASKQRLSAFETTEIPATINVPTSAKYVRFSIRLDKATQIMLTEGSTPPASFVPFGYEVDISVSDGTNATTTPIYIGDDPLEKDEYVDYQAGKIYRYETEIKKDLSQTGWQWRWETDNVTYQASLNNRVSVGRFYPEETKEYVISAVPDTFEVAVISADSSDVKTADTGWGASWTLSGASAHSFCVTIRKSDNSDITPSEVDGVKFKVTSLTPTDPPVTLPALPTVEGETIVDYAGQSVAPEKVLFEYAKGGK